MKLHLSMKGSYVAPRTYITAAAPEGLVCASFNMVGVQVDEIYNLNGEDIDEGFDFEF